MTFTAATHSAPIQDITERLRSRREEIEDAVWTRVTSIEASPTGIDDSYRDGLREAVSGSIDFAIRTMESGACEIGDIPSAMRAQARLAARSGVSLETVLRRYLAGYTLFSEFVIQEAVMGATPPPAELDRVVRFQTSILDRILAAVGDEYSRSESEHRARLKGDRRAGCIENLLAGELVDPTELNYDLGGFHLGMVASGGEAERQLRAVASDLGARTLRLGRGNGVLWVWLGRRSPIDPAEAKARITGQPDSDLRVALGEMGEGKAGWRLSHRQASAAWPIALNGAPSCVRYAEVALVAAARHDQVLKASLRSLYLEPLASGQDNGRTLKETLRTYLSVSRNVSSTAAALGVSRQTVQNRIRLSERCIGRRVDECAGDLEVALGLESILE